MIMINDDDAKNGRIKDKIRGEIGSDRCIYLKVCVTQLYSYILTGAVLREDLFL